MMPNLPTYYEYANGMKTGNTNAAGQCIVASAQKDDRNLICVILKGIKYSEKDAEIQFEPCTLPVASPMCRR